ncbi:MAG: ECF transporter S component [Clostridia bacterium]|nr:ECF transporter S component [Clostridia bacterium]
MHKKPSKVTLISIISLLFIAPLCIFLCAVFIKSKSYYAAAVIVIICAILPFFAFFEKRKVKTGEIVIIALMTALGVASRSVMMFLPQVKPTCALVIVTAIAFGPNVGFLTGALTMFLSNFIFGQGMFTPFQMLGMGLVGFLCGLIFNEKKYAANRYIVSITGGILCFLVYGLIADSCSVLMLSSSFSLSSILTFFASGLTFNIIHGITTAILLFFINKPMTDKFSRLRVKYGIFSAK